MTTSTLPQTSPSDGPVDAVFNGCTTTRIFCRPDCPPGRRTKPEHRVAFADEREAAGAGYRPCRVCTPLDGPPGPWVSKRKRG